jgi:hypothetical protein
MSYHDQMSYCHVNDAYQCYYFFDGKEQKSKADEKKLHLLMVLIRKKGKQGKQEED